MQKLPLPLAGVDLDAVLDVLADRVADRIAARMPQPAPSTPAPLLSRHETARQLGISIATLDRLDVVGQPFLRVGDAKKYDLAAVLAWHRKRTAAEPSAPAPAPAAPAAPAGVRRVSIGGKRTR